MTKRSPELLHPTPATAAVEEDLRVAIWKDPTNRETLRVYADWLAEQGSTRGEYMQLCLLDSPTDAQKDAASSMLKKNGGMWLGEARPFIRTWRYADETPGFLSWVEVEAYRLIEGFEHIVKLGPQMRCSITSMRTKRRETEEKMAKLPLAKLGYIELRANALDDKSLATLSHGMQGVRALRLDYNDFGGKGLEALGGNVTTLRALCLQPAVKFRGAARDNSPWSANSNRVRP